MPDERRSARRAQLSGVRVTYEEATGERVEADVLDLGSGGLFVRTATPLAVGKRISLEMQILGEPTPWSALGRVVWTRTKSEGDKRPPGMGVKLIDVDDEVVAAIERLVETRERTEPGVGKPSSPPPPAPVIAVPPERERTLMGVGATPPSTPPPPEVAREQSIAIDLVPRRPPPSRPPSMPPPRGTSSGRWIVIALLMVVVAIAAYVLVDGFLRPIPH